MSSAVVFIDLQRGYFEDPDLARFRTSLVRQANRLAAAAREHGCALYHVVTEHERDKSTWTLSMRDDDQGFNFSGSAQAQPLEGLDLDDAHRIVKIRDSAFFGTDLAQRMRVGGARRIAIAGVSGQNCISRSGADAFSHDFRVAYAGEAIGSEDPERCAESLRMLSRELRQPVLDTDELIGWLTTT